MMMIRFFLLFILVIFSPLSVYAKDLNKGLLYLSANGSPGQVRKIIKQGADPNHVDENGVTALSLASYYGMESNVKVLIKAGAEVNFLNDGELGALGVAINQSKNEVVEILLKAGARPNHSRLLLSPMYTAMKADNLKAAQLLLDSGVELNTREVSDDESQYVLHFGLEIMLDEEISDEMASLLLKNGLELQEFLDKKETLPVLKYLISENNNLGLRRALSWGLNPNVTFEDGSTPLHFAIRDFDTYSLEILLSCKEIENAPDKYGITPLGLARAEYFEEAVKMLENRFQ
ncbi:ankyrin repeat domain-containing protein [Microbulbifer sp. JMSA003]|uniref:ankyrin repeat domain-containing protein n=1 Tax=unclassified Microbulbifer TaxID=2619833 RepID=UPI0040399E42